MRRTTRSTAKAAATSETSAPDADGVPETKNRKTTRSTAAKAASAAAPKDPAPDTNGAVQKKKKMAAPKAAKGKAKLAVVEEREREDIDTDTVPNPKAKGKGKNKRKDEKGAPAPKPDPSASRPPSPSPSKNPDQVTDSAINASASVADPPAPRAPPASTPPASPPPTHSRPTRGATPINRDTSAPLESPQVQIKKDPYASYRRSFTPIVLDHDEDEDWPKFQDRSSIGYDETATQEEVEDEPLHDGRPLSPSPERTPEVDDPMIPAQDADEEQIEPELEKEAKDAEEQQKKEYGEQERGEARRPEGLLVYTRKPHPHDNPQLAEKIAQANKAATAAPHAAGPRIRINFANPLAPTQSSRQDSHRRPPQPPARSPLDPVDEEEEPAPESDEDGSNYSASAALERKEAARHNRRADQVPWVARMDSQEEQDAEDYQEFLKSIPETAGSSGGAKKGKGKGKGKTVAQGGGEAASGRDEQNVGGGTRSAGSGLVGEDDDEGDDDPEQPATPWDITPGPLSKADLEVALEARRVYHSAIEDVARRAGKRMSAVFRAVGDLTKSARNTNSWNAFQAKYRAENAKEPDESKSEYAERIRAAYHDLFSSLPEEERNDPDARRACLDGTMEWYQTATLTVLDDRKADGHSQAVLSKQAQPFISLSTVVSNTTDVDFWGFGHDSFSDESLIWGGSPMFCQVYQDPQFRGAIKMMLNEMKGMFQTARMLNRRTATIEGALAQPAVFVDFNRKPSEKNGRDAKRRQLGQLFLNDIYHALMARGEDLKDLQVKIKKMSWKWSDLACTYMLRIENWPVALKDAFPGPGFSLGQIKGREAVRALEGMVDDMKIRYESAEEAPGEGVRIVSWTQEEIDLDDIDDIASIPIIVCCDESVLMLAQTSKKLLRKRPKKKRNTGDDPSDQEEEEEEEEEAQADDDDDATDIATDIATDKKLKGAEKGKKRSQPAADDEPPAKRARRSTSPAPPPASRPPARSRSNPHASGSKLTATSTTRSNIPATSTSKTAVARNRTKTAAPRSDSSASPPLLKFRYQYKGVMSDVFFATGMRRVDPPTRVNRYTLMWTLGAWSQVPEGYEPIVAPEMEAYCEVLQMNIRLLT